MEGHFGSLALDTLDKAIAKADPDSRRIFPSVAAANVDDVPPARRGSVAIERVIRQLSPSVMLNQHLRPEQFAVQMHDVVVGSVATAVSRSEVALKRGQVEMIGPTPTSEGSAR